MPRSESPSGKWQQLRRWIGWLCLLVFFLAAFLPLDLWVDGGMNLTLGHSGPTSEHWLGTDQMGRDLLLRLTSALKHAVIPLWLVSFAAMILGMLVGVTSSLWVERSGGSTFTFLLTAFGSIFVSIPVGILVFTFAVLQERAGIGPVLWSLFAVFGIRTFLQVIDLLRQDQNLEYWQAHKTMGGRFGTRIWRYGVLGAWRVPMLDTLVFHLQVSVAIEASLSYLGFGIQEPKASFGNILSSHLDLFLRGEWGILGVVCASLAVCAAVPSLIRWLIGSAFGLQPNSH